MTLHDYANQVGAIVKQDYGYDDGAGLCFNLIEMGMIDQDKDDTAYAAQIVARHIEQP